MMQLGGQLHYCLRCFLGSAVGQFVNLLVSFVPVKDSLNEMNVYLKCGFLKKERSDEVKNTIYHAHKASCCISSTLRMESRKRRRFSSPRARIIGLRYAFL